jgi:tight adherence protein B
VTVIPAEAASYGEFGVVLVIDASRSMRGDAIAAAVRAAKAFAAQRNESQQVAVVAFNDRPIVVLPFTGSQADIDAALATEPALAVKTHLYDAVDLGLTLLERAEITAGSLVVLSDGADTGSRAKVEAVIERARSAHVRIFSVGLRSHQFRPEPLKSLAAGSGGDYSDAASAGELTSIFDQLGSKLANEYVVQYRSPARPGQDVHVSVRLEGFDEIGIAEYTAPALGRDAAAAFHRSFAERFWASTGGMVATVAFAAGLVALALMTMLRPRRRSLRKRMSEFVSVALASDGKDGRAPGELVLASKTEETLGRTRWWTRFTQKLELAEIRTSAAHIVLGTAVGTIIAMWLLYQIGGSPIFAPLALLVPLIVRALINRKVERKRQQFADQLPDNLQVLASALRAGHSLVGALSVVVDDCAEPSKSEFGRVVADEQLGISLETAFQTVADRMANRDLEQVALVAALQRDTGGNTAEVLDRVAETVRGRFELRRLVKTLTTQGRMSRWVVSLLPVGLLILITLINPAYMKPLYVHPIGRVLLVVAGLMIVAGSLVIKRIINIKV